MELAEVKMPFSLQVPALVFGLLKPALQLSSSEELEVLSIEVGEIEDSPPTFPEYE